MALASEYLRMKPLPSAPADEAPPPYEAKPRNSPVPETQAPPRASPGPPMPPPPSQVARQFPPAFNVYSQSFSRTMILGEHQDQPFYAMSIHSGLSSSPPIVLHSGPTNTSPPLASVEHHSFSSRMSITLPPAPRGSPGGAPIVDLESKMDFPSSSYVFAIGVGPNCERLEQFQWRPSAGEAIAMLDGRSRGWKLVRLAHSAGPAAFRGSDGKEVVAVWTDAGMSMTKLAKFAFTGSGLTGELGERWAIMAVISGLAICERQRQRRRNHNH
ncbi:hypothetical protein ColTof4_14277 [Colletotrichum tofieldiae]|uniref:Uncharacterized protein n=1 Tax=Colletotrichum tofieldiae TaxID=708197 RepID=A0A166NX77_9PEZI|nr:hypothetical protein CT0861_11225 [Colletotrichum tofieldiae]GKT52695.1 hypothetical protein ColTof3_00034 [Colletotrichum tofieldiae]GKT81854.1 hypothetical protein ColTof4_14277 [Colletotrichum tofieldiae]GKT89038.1 hypothetical protein Ct61P_06888 [Colletotrichum tofieldiae]